MKMSLRRITGKGDQGGSMTAKQQELWSILLKTLACDVKCLTLHIQTYQEKNEITEGADATHFCS